MGIIYALMEIKHMCEQQERCVDCQLYNEYTERCGMREAPHEWNLKYDVMIKDSGSLFVAVEEEQ